MYQPFEVDVWLILRSDIYVIFLFCCSFVSFHFPTAFLRLVYHKIVEIARPRAKSRRRLQAVKSFCDIPASSA